MATTEGVQVGLSTEARTEAEPFEGSYLREYLRVVALAYAISGDRSAAEDIAQDAFIDRPSSLGLHRSLRRTRRLGSPRSHKRCHFPSPTIRFGVKGTRSNSSRAANEWRLGRYGRIHRQLRADHHTHARRCSGGGFMGIPPLRPFPFLHGSSRGAGELHAGFEKARDWGRSTLCPAGRSVDHGRTLYSRTAR